MKVAFGRKAWAPKDEGAREGALPKAVVEYHTADARRNGSCVCHDGKGSCGLRPRRGSQLRT